MLETISRPLAPRAILLLCLGLVGANTLYCLLYTALAGHPESLGQALGWTIANVLPWLLAFEAGKRWPPPLAVLAGLVLSLALGMLLLSAEPTGFEIARRLPGAIIVLGLLLLLRRREVKIGAARIDLPLPPERITWVAAAGNYVELHGAGRPLLIRAPMSAVEATLAPHGFVRIHRSTLVNRSRVARVRTADLLLDDGRSLKLGTRFRAQFQA